MLWLGPWLRNNPKSDRSDPKPFLSLFPTNEWFIEASYRGPLHCWARVPHSFPMCGFTLGSCRSLSKITENSHHIATCTSATKLWTYPLLWDIPTALGHTQQSDQTMHPPISIGSQVHSRRPEPTGARSSSPCLAAGWCSMRWSPRIHASMARTRRIL